MTTQTKKYIRKDGEVKIYEYNGSAYCKKHYLKNKDKYSKKFDCECGGCYKHINKSHHMKTKRHQRYLMEKEKN